MRYEIFASFWFGFTRTKYQNAVGIAYPLYNLLIKLTELKLYAILLLAVHRNILRTIRCLAAA